MVRIGNDWDELLKGEFDKEYYLKLRQFLIQEYKERRFAEFPQSGVLMKDVKLSSYVCLILVEVYTLEVNNHESLLRVVKELAHSELAVLNILLFHKA